MLRQPIRSMLLVLLIATASFAFVVRAVEYGVVSDRISEISDFFHNVGTLTHRDGITADVSEAAQWIAQSPYVSFYDRRRGFEGTLTDMHNAYIEGSRYWTASWAYRYHYDDFWSRPYIDLMPRLSLLPTADFAGFVSGNSYFYGELLDIVYVQQLGDWRGDWGFYPHKLLYVRVDHVLQGYPERVFEGQTLRLRMDFPENRNAPETWDSPLRDMEIGQRYFFKGTFYFMLGRLQMDSRTITMMIKPIGEDGVWYVPVQPGESVDTAALGLSHELEFAQHVQSAVHLRTTRDMTAMPHTQEGLDIFTLRGGRFIDLDDYLHARPVVVINRRFAERRNISIGDTITVNVSSQQHLVYSPYYFIGSVDDTGSASQLITGLPELGVLSTPGASPTITLALEVVGIYDLFRMRLISTDWSSINKFMYIPDSLLPDNWGLQSAYLGHTGPNYTPTIWYSFVLHDQRDQAAFLMSTRDALADMGVRVNFVGRDGSGFWASADLILMSITLNLIMFSTVLILVLILTVALFIWQRNKEYAILRSLGCSAKNIFMQSTTALMFFGLPAVLAGSAAGWFYAIRLSEDAIAGFGEIITSEIGVGLLHSEREALMAYYMAAALPPISYLAVLCMAILGIMLIFIIIGHLRLAKKSVLETLQGAR